MRRAIFLTDTPLANLLSALPLSKVNDRDELDDYQRRNRQVTSNKVNGMYA